MLRLGGPVHLEEDGGEHEDEGGQYCVGGCWSDGE